MELDLTSLQVADSYKLLTSVVVPRPIAWVTTLDTEGRLNTAPFSFFNLLGSNPPVIGLGIASKKDGTPKDTRANILARGELVVNLVDERLMDAMNLTSIEFEAGVDEARLAGLTTLPSVAVQVPRLAESRVHLECRLAQVVRIGANEIVLAEVVHLHIADGFVDPASRRVDTRALQLVGRGHGGSMYLHLSDWFEAPRPTLEAWQHQAGAARL